MVNYKFVNVYAVTRVYGGPEEGGWWYDTGELMFCKPFENADDAYEYAESISDKYPTTGKRYSVLGGEDYNVRVENDPGEDFPKETPYYC
jgi:hypothetical protein